MRSILYEHEAVYRENHENSWTFPLKSSSPSSSSSKERALLDVFHFKILSAWAGIELALDVTIQMKTFVA